MPTSYWIRMTFTNLFLIFSYYSMEYNYSYRNIISEWQDMLIATISELGIYLIPLLCFRISGWRRVKLTWSSLSFLYQYPTWYISRRRSKLLVLTIAEIDQILLDFFLESNFLLSSLSPNKLIKCQFRSFDKTIQ